MSFPTKPAFVHVGTWDDETRKHPAMKWMEDYTLNFNARGGWDKKSTDWHTSDFTLVKPDATVYDNADEAFQQVKEMYASFTKEFHEPYFLVVWENSDGYEMLGQAHLFGNIPGQASAGEQKVRDGQGREWDVKIPGAFHFHYVKNPNAAHGGFELKRAEIISDSMPAVQILMKRGLLKL